MPLWLLLACAARTAPVSLPPAPEPMPLVIGHRGAPGYLPDHTLEGYRLAAQQGADAIEPDLVCTADGVLVARHENELSLTTDVAGKFPERRRSAVVDGQPAEGWFVEDFTWAEIQTLRARQPWPERPHDHDDLYVIPTFDQVLVLASQLATEAGRSIRVVPELKHPTHFRTLGLPLEERFEEALTRWGGDPALVTVQSFELRNLEEMGPDRGYQRLFLVDEPGLVIPGDTRTYGEVLADLQALRHSAEALGVPREMVWAQSGPTGFVEQAHAAGLQVIVWTFRAERPGPAAQGGGMEAEVRVFFELGVDGVFADQPDVAVRARN